MSYCILEFQLEISKLPISPSDRSIRCDPHCLPAVSFPSVMLIPSGPSLPRLFSLQSLSPWRFYLRNSVSLVQDLHFPSSVHSPRSLPGALLDLHNLQICISLRLGYRLLGLFLFLVFYFLSSAEI